MANIPELYEYEKSNAPKDLVNRYWKTDSPDGLDKIDQELKGGKDHSKLMLLLQNHIYEDRLNTSGIEGRHHDLLDKENKIMAEVGTNGLASNDLRDFLVRMFRLHYNRRETEGLSEWTHYYLNYNLELYRVELTNKGCEELRRQIEALEKSLQDLANNLSL